jgi:hypothetical protein
VLFLSATFLEGAGEARPNATRLVVSINWTMPDRFGRDANGNGLPDLPNTPSYVNGDAGPGGAPRFSVDLDLKVAEPAGTRRPVSIESASWTVRAFGCTPRVGITCPGVTAEGQSPDVALPEGVYDASVTFSGRTSGPLRRVVSGRATQRIRVEDFLIVSIGDSYASGEGNPEQVRRSKQGDCDRQLVFWADSGTVGEQTATPHLACGYGAGVVGAAKSLATTRVGRDHVRSHRSTLSASAQAALGIERSDIRSSVTFVSVAASGATINKGLVEPYKGVENEPDSAWMTAMPPQLDQVASLVGNRTIDALTVSIGGNDIGFGNVVTALILADDEDDRRLILGAVKTGNWNLVDASIDRMGLASYANIPGGGLDGLPLLYEKLATEIRAKLRPHRVYITEYPDPTKWVSRNGIRHYCDKMLGAIARFQGKILGNAHIDEAESKWAYEKVLVPLNYWGRVAALRYGWKQVAGIAGSFGNGHGMCAARPYDPAAYSGNPYPLSVSPSTAPDFRWLRVGRESQTIQGPPEAWPSPFQHLFTDRKSSTGTLHPNELGHRAIMERLLESIGRTPHAAPTAGEVVVPESQVELVSMTRGPLLAGAVVALAVGPLLLLTTDFGGWTERTSNATTSYYRSDAYGYYYTDYWVGLDAIDLPGYAKVLLVLVAAGFLVPAAQALRSRLPHAWRSAAVVAGCIAAGGLLFAAQVSGEYDWWLGAGFYGSLAATLLAAGLLYGAARLAGATATPATGPAPSPPAHFAAAAPRQTLRPLETAGEPAVSAAGRAVYRTDRRRGRIVAVGGACAALVAGAAVAIRVVSGLDESEAEPLATEPVDIASQLAGYTTVLDETGTISLAVPEGWRDVDRSSVEEGGQSFPGIYAAPDVEAYKSSWSAPGLSLRALPLEELDLAAIVAARADGWDTGTCQRTRPEVETGVAHLVLVDCGGGGEEFHLFAMHEQGESYVRYLELNLPPVELRADDILATVPRSTSSEG